MRVTIIAYNYCNRNLFQAKRLHSFLGWEVVISKRCLGLCWLHDSKQTESSSWLDCAGNSQWIQERSEVRAGNIRFCLFTTLNMYNLIASKLQWVWTVDRATCVASPVAVVTCSFSCCMWESRKSTLLSGPKAYDFYLTVKPTTRC